MNYIYDDIIYIENMKNDNIEEETKIIPLLYSNKNDNKQVNYENQNDVINIIELMSERKMYHKLLRETLDELDKTNRYLEYDKYNLFCIYANRYNNKINTIESQILWYEYEILLRREKNISNLWHWCWYLMTFFKVYKNDCGKCKKCKEINKKGVIEKKND